MPPLDIIKQSKEVEVSSAVNNSYLCCFAMSHQTKAYENKTLTEQHSSQNAVITLVVSLPETLF